MSTKHVRTAADLVRFDCGLKIECRACGASRTLSGYDVAKMGGIGPLAALQPRLRCDRCGQKGAKLTVLPPIERR